MSEDPESSPKLSTKSPLVVGLVPLLTLIATFLIYRQLAGIGLMGFDSYPLILTARIDSLASFLGTFSEELMDGRYSGDYYRPALNLSFALDTAIWGLKPVGYQLTGALLFGACALSVGALMARLLRGRVGAGVLAATVFFLLQDSHFEVIPVPARRPELLCGLFACLSLASQLTTKNLAKRWVVLPAAWMFLAAASKETGYALPAISVLAVILYSPATNLKDRFLHGLRVGAVHGGFILLLLAARISVLGGLGGPAALPEGFVGPSAIELTTVLFGRLFVPQNVVAWGAVVPGAAVAFAACVLFAIIYSPRGRTALGVAAAWMVVVGLLYGISRSIEQWYLFLPVIGLALAVGASVDILAGLVEEQRRAFASVLAIAIAAFTVCQTRYSPLVHDYQEWAMATAASDEFFDKLSRRIERKPVGSQINAPAVPLWYPAPESGPGVRGGAVLEDYSVQAWLELTYPDRRFRVLKQPPQVPLDADETAVLFVRPFLFQPLSQ